MNRARTRPPPLTVCVLTFGPHLPLAQRCIDSIRTQTQRSLYRLVVGANAVGEATEKYLRFLKESGAADRIHFSRRNLDKNPMMRRMFRDLNTRFVVWFDDDSYVVEKGALERLLDLALRSARDTVMWGRMAMCNHPSMFTSLKSVERFVRTAPWYRGLTPPGRAPGGKGEFDFEGRGSGNPRWEFLSGGFWLMRTWAIRMLDWPDRRLTHLGEDVLLGEAIRQQGWSMAHVASLGVVIGEAPTRRSRAQRIGTDPGNTRIKPESRKDK